MANSPRAFVSNASLPLDFLGRYAMACAGHQVHRKEPDRELGAALVKDGPGCRVDVMTAPLAGVGPPLGHLVELHPFGTNRAIGFLAAVLDLHDPAQAGRVIRVFGLELLEGVLGHGLSP